jgi:hypothetical protein
LAGSYIQAAAMDNMGLELLRIRKILDESMLSIAEDAAE